MSSDFRARAVVVQAGMTHQHATHPAVNVLQCQIVGASALLQLGHRRDKLQTRPAINLRQRQGTREARSAGPNYHQPDQNKLAADRHHRRPGEILNQLIMRG